MYRIAIVEDEEKYYSQIKAHLEKLEQERGVVFRLARFENGADFVERFTPTYDLVLMDISMPGMDGMQAAREMRQKDPDVALVFITSMASYAIQGYTVSAMDYIVKPVEYTVFALKIDKVLAELRQREKTRVLVKLKEEIVQLAVEQIYYIEVRHHELCFFTALGEYSVRGTLRDMEEKLKGAPFARSGSSFLVNLRHTEDIGKETLVVAGKQLPLSRRYKKDFLAALTNYFGK